MNENENDSDCAPDVIAGERPAMVFVSSVMVPELQWARDGVVRSVADVPFLFSWAFEYTPASSEDVDSSYLQKVRQSSLLVLLIGDSVTRPVVSEVSAALDSETRMIVLQLPAKSRSSDTERLIERIRSKVKFRELKTLDPSELRKEIKLAIGDEFVRALRKLPDANRIARIKSRGRASRQRVIESFQAAGLTPKLAEDFGDDPAVGRLSSAMENKPENPVRVIVGEVGAGKSLVGERCHQHDLSEFLEDPLAPVPVWMPLGELVGGLESVVEARCHGLANPVAQGASVVIDGADEIDLASARRVLTEARVLVATWPQTTVLITTRPIPDFERNEERVNVGPLSEESAQALVFRVASRDPNMGEVHGWPESVVDAIRLPLFALLLGVAISELPEAPKSRAELVATLAEAAVTNPSLEETAQRLAIATIEAEGDPVRLNELTSPHEVERLLETRLVVEHGGNVSFPLIIFAQWFAASAIAEGAVPPEQFEGIKNGEKWFYPLAILASRYPHDVVTKVLAPLAETDPGFASRVVEEAFEKWGSHLSRPQAALQAAARVRRATLSWVKGLDELGVLVAPFRADGTLAALGGRRDGSSLTLIWNREPQLEDVLEIPESVDILRSGPGWGPGRSGQPVNQPAWAWHWSFDVLRHQLSNVLNDRGLSRRGTPFQNTAIYQIVAKLNNHGSLTSESFEIQGTLDRIDEINRRVETLGGPPTYEVVREYLVNLLGQGTHLVDSPFPGRDLLKAEGSWIWIPYSPEQLRRRTEAVFSTALQGYEALIHKWFPMLSKRMRTAATLPAVLRGSLRPSTSSEYEGGPRISWHFEALPSSEHSRVEISLGDADWSSQAEIERVTGEFNELRPEFGGTLSPTFQMSVLDVFRVGDAEELAYSWIWDDLKTLNWTKGMLGQYSDVNLTHP